MSIELRNCAQEAVEAMRDHNATVKKSIAGPYTVVEFFPWHCRSTDAIVGAGVALRGTLATREEAKALAAALAGEELTDSRFEVWPLEAEITVSDQAVELTDTPF